MLDQPVLYSFRRCPYAMRARLALRAARQPVWLREVVLRDKPAALLAASPKGTVPVLVLPDGTVIDESRAIMHWALARRDPHDWLVDRAASEALIDALDTVFKPALDRTKYATRYPGEDPAAARAVCAQVLTDYESRLARHAGTTAPSEAAWAGPGLVGPALRLADIAALPFVRQFAFIDKAWFDAQPWPHVHTWLARFLNGAPFAAIMEKYPQWQPGTADTAF